MKNQLLVAFFFEVALAPRQWAVTDQSAAAVHACRVAGPCLLAEMAGLHAKIWISVLLSLVPLWSIWHFAGPEGFSLCFFFNFISCFSIVTAVSATSNCIKRASVQHQAVLCVSGKSPSCIFFSNIPTSHPQSLLSLAIVCPGLDSHLPLLLCRLSKDTKQEDLF